MGNLLRCRMLRLAAVRQDPAAKALARVRETDRSSLTAAPSPASAGLNGVRVLITGGTGGIGLAVARGFASAGARVAITGRDDTRVQAAAAEIGPGTLALTARLNSDGSLAKAFAKLQSAFGGLDILINNAGISGPATDLLWELAPDDFDAVMQVNTSGAFRAAA